MSDIYQQLAEQIRATCVQAALDAYEDAGVSGLCAEGRWEYTVGVLRGLDFESLLRNAALERIGNSGET